ncbi:hypothetical protein CERSUDRAFT_120489 [Gelatoporia subvermispora B]|uniref:Secreted protein n=1 Tax=Ceriporiopsis subvermispora (strain B) TaxID=914234 RepID=M2QWA0_CERS8|nr:hypothetical protein CERSUDRAFT_120489 [Gelatoporia subvermispora B]
MLKAIVTLAVLVGASSAQTMDVSFYSDNNCAGLTFSCVNLTPNTACTPVGFPPESANWANPVGIAAGTRLQIWTQTINQVACGGLNTFRLPQLQCSTLTPLNLGCGIYQNGIAKRDEASTVPEGDLPVPQQILSYASSDGFRYSMNVTGSGDKSLPQGATTDELIQFLMEHYDEKDPISDISN